MKDLSRRSKFRTRSESALHSIDGLAEIAVGGKDAAGYFRDLGDVIAGREAMMMPSRVILGRPPPPCGLLHRTITPLHNNVCGRGLQNDRRFYTECREDRSCAEEDAADSKSKRKRVVVRHEGG